MTATIPSVQALRERAAKAREFTHKAGNGWVFQLRRPSALNLRAAALNDQLAGDDKSASRFKRDQVFGALFGWQGPTIADIDTTADAEVGALPLPFDAELSELLFADRVGMLEEIFTAIMDQVKAAIDKQEATTKN